MKNAMLVLVSLLSAFVCVHGAQKPNILFILVDDYGIKDVGIEGSSFYETPNIDALARSGTRFTQGYAACQVCSPSRASILLGKYPARHGITDWIGAGVGEAFAKERRVKLLPSEYTRSLPAADVTLAEALKQAGYATFFAGKWHLGGEGSWPENHGFDINKGGWDVGSPMGGYFSPWQNPNLPSGPKGESLTQRLANETITFIEQHKNKPFLAYLSFYAVHSPIQTTKPLWSKYREKASKLPKPDERFKIDRTLPVRQVQDNPVYAGLVESMDTAVGTVLRKLDELGLANNTIVCFTSDNGGVSSGDNFSSSMLPYRGGKGRQWEGGLRVPFYVRAPAFTRPGSVCDNPVIHTDFYPTILELAGVQPLPQQHVDGMSLVPLLKGDKMSPRPLFWHYPHYGNQGGEPSSVIQKSGWKLIHYWEDNRNELYRLAEDIGEQHDLAKQEVARTEQLWTELQSWLKETGAKIPQPYAAYNLEWIEQSKKSNLSQKARLEQSHAEYLKPDWQPDPTWWKSEVSTAASPSNTDSAQQPAAAIAGRPNVVIMLVDDMGVMDTSLPFMTDDSGKPKRYPLNDFYRTPNMERLAACGIRFNNFCAMSVCSPTRISIMTGQNAARHRTTNWINPDKDNTGPQGPPDWNWRGLKPGDITLPRLLSTAGYRTIHVGKGHFSPRAFPGADPAKIGFDINVGGGSIGAPGSYYGTNNFGGKNAKQATHAVPHLEKYHGQDIFLTEALTLEAKRCMSDAVNADKPFFLYFAQYAVHAPFNSDPRFAAHYKDSGKPAPAQAFATLIEGMDKSLGDILDYLDQIGVAENTLVIFLGDNGSDAPLGHQHAVACAAPLRGKKGSHYEGGMRVPFIAAWAKASSANPHQKRLPIAVGAIQKQQAAVQDLFPTVLSIAGVVPPSNHLVDGLNLKTLLSGKTDSNRKEQFLMHYPHAPHRTDYFTVWRDRDWKVIYHYFPSEVSGGSHYQLYNLAKDPFEQEDLAKQETAQLRRMMDGLIAALEQHQAVYPVDKEERQPIRPKLP